jgi:hypothetical protein
MAMAPAANNAPVIEGLAAEAKLRGRAVALAAAGLSSGVTTDVRPIAPLAPPVP